MIYLDRDSGFCQGVDGALRSLMKLLISGENLAADGDIIHNSAVMEILKRNGLSVSIRENTAHVIRTHGTLYSTLQSLNKHNSRVINLTCRNVSFIQSSIKKYSSRGYHCIITGHPGHPEVLSVSSYAPPEQVTVIEDLSQTDTIPAAEKYLLVSQTTFSTIKFERISEELQKRIEKKIKIINTICDAASNRQSRIDGIDSKKFDTVIVIGGRHSSNTRKLADRAAELGYTTYHIETSSEIPKDLTLSRGIYVTAGASTPGWIIEDCMKRIRINSLPVIIRPLAEISAFVKRNGILDTAVCLLTAYTAASYDPSCLSYLLPSATAVQIMRFQQSTYRKCVSSGTSLMNFIPQIILFPVFIFLMGGYADKHMIPLPDIVPVTALLAAGIISSYPGKKRNIARYITYETAVPVILVMLFILIRPETVYVPVSLLFCIPWQMAERSQLFSRHYLIERSPFVFSANGGKWITAAVAVHIAICTALVAVAVVSGENFLYPLLAAVTATVYFILSIFLRKRSLFN